MNKPPTKQDRVAAILQCAHAIAEHYGTTAEKLLSATCYRGQEIQNARNVFTYHLHDCDMSIASIARLLTRSIDSTDRRRARGTIMLMGKDRAMIDALPRIPSSLTFAPATP